MARINEEERYDLAMPPGTKNAWLYVFASNPLTIGWQDHQHVFYDLYFSSPENFMNCGEDR